MSTTSPILSSTVYDQLRISTEQALSTLYEEHPSALLAIGYDWLDHDDFEAIDHDPATLHDFMADTITNFYREGGSRHDEAQLAQLLADLLVVLAGLARPHNYTAHHKTTMITANDIFTTYRFDHSPHVQAVLLEGVADGDPNRELDATEAEALNGCAKAYAELRDQLRAKYYYHRDDVTSDQMFNAAVRSDRTEGLAYGIKYGTAYRIGDIYRQMMAAVED